MYDEANARAGSYKANISERKMRQGSYPRRESSVLMGGVADDIGIIAIHRLSV